MQEFTTVGLIILVVYLTTVSFASLLFPKKEMKRKELFKGDGAISWWVTPVSIFTISLGPVPFLSLVRNSYAGTQITWFAQLGVLVVIPTTIRFFLPIYSKLGINTAYHHLGIRFGSKGLHVLGAVMFTVYQVNRVSITMYLPFMALPSLTGINVNVLIIAMGMVVVIYPYTDGLKSILRTDFIQDSVLLVGVTFASFYLIHGIDGDFGSVFSTIGQGKFLTPDQPIFSPNILKNSVFSLVVGVGFSTCSSYVSSQDIVQRFTTTMDTKELSGMILTDGALSIFVATISCLIDTGLYVSYSQNAFLPVIQQDRTFASYIAYGLPVSITGLLLAAIYAASQPILSTGLNSVATSWTLDIQGCLPKKEMDFTLQTRIAQYISLGMGVVATLVSMILANGKVKSAYKQLSGFTGLVPDVLGETFVPGTFAKVANTKGACVAFFVAAITMVYIKCMAPAGVVSIWPYSIISVAISLVMGLPVDVITRKIDGDTSRPATDATIYHN